MGEEGGARDGIVDRYSVSRDDLLLSVMSGRYCPGCCSDLRPAETFSSCLSCQVAIVPGVAVICVLLR